MAQAFSCVMSVYRGDDPKYFRQALESVLNQTVLPEQLILVVDGQVGDKLNNVISSYECHPILKVIRLSKNVGPGAARHIAILEATTPIIAVMDSDDICVRTRFELQIKVLDQSDVDVVGGFIAEFAQDPVRLEKIRKVPIDHEQIIRRGRLYLPVNHVTIMFFKEAYLRAGGYRAIRKVEDYDLFHRMAMGGLRFSNIPEVLVLVRSSDEQYRRRHGWLYLREEITLHCDMFNSGYIGLVRLINNIAIRLPIRLLPVFILRSISKNFLRSTEG